MPISSYKITIMIHIRHSSLSVFFFVWVQNVTVSKFAERGGKRLLTLELFWIIKPSNASAYIREYGFVMLVIADSGCSNADFCRKIS
jgi:hypothetical protein